MIEEYSIMCLLYIDYFGLTGQSYTLGIWRPTECWFGFVATEPYNRTDFECRELHNEELKIYSLNDAEGICSVDAWEEVSFNRGSEAIISLGDPLKVLIPNE